MLWDVKRDASLVQTLAIHATPCEVYRDLKYVIAQCEQLAAQLAAMRL